MKRLIAHINARYCGGPIVIDCETSMAGPGVSIASNGETFELADVEVLKVYAVPPDYDAYINSYEWFERREKYFSTHKRVCYMCGAPQDVELHHMTYERLGHEYDDDLEPLCSNCHGALHRLKGELSYISSNIEDGARQIREEYLAKAQEEIRRRTELYMERQTARIESAFKRLLPPVIGGHKPHIASIIRDTCSLREYVHSHRFVKLLKSK